MTTIYYKHSVPTIVTLNSEQNTHTEYIALRHMDNIELLNNDRHHEITSIQLTSIPEGLASLDLRLYSDKKSHQWDARHIQHNTNILPHPIAASKWARLHQLIFTFDKEFLLAREHSEMQDEIVLMYEPYGNEIEIMDDIGEVHYGQRFHTIKEPTGRQVKRITQSVPVNIPRVDVTIQEQ